MSIFSKSWMEIKAARKGFHDWVAAPIFLYFSPENGILKTIKK